MTSTYAAPKQARNSHYCVAFGVCVTGTEVNKVIGENKLHPVKVKDRKGSTGLVSRVRTQTMEFTFGRRKILMAWEGLEVTKICQTRYDGKETGNRPRTAI